MKVGKFLIGMVALVALVVATPINKAQGQVPKTKTEVLSKGNLLVLNGPIDGESVSALIKQARQIDAELDSIPNRLKGNDSTHIKLFVFSPGGEIQAGMEMLEALKGLKHKVDTITLFAASMAFQTVEALGDREILGSGVLMSHRAAGQFEGFFGGAEPSQLTARYQLWLDRVTEFDKNTVERTNGKQTLDSYRKQYAEEMWLTGKKSVEQGYADEVVQVRCDSSLSGVSTHTVNFMGIDINYDLDNCPLNTSPMNVRAAQAPGGGEGDKSTGTGVIVITSAKDTAAILAKFKEQYEAKQRAIIPMTF